MLEKTGKVLAKVKISGGGRCNVTHNCPDPAKLLEYYPRGNPWLSSVFSQFSVKDSIKWFSNRGVEIVPEADGRMFPKSNDSQTIINALLGSVQGSGYALDLHQTVQKVEKVKEGFELFFEGKNSLICRNLLIASGGSASGAGFSFLKPLDLSIVPPVPSLFTFNVPKHPWAELQGVSVKKARVILEGTLFGFTGPLLVTHWGFSGPAVLKLSAFGARILHEKQYRYSFSIDWFPDQTETSLLVELTEYQQQNPKRKPDQSQIFDLPKRLWEQLCKDSGLTDHFNWAEVGKKKLAALAKSLKKTTFAAEGKTTFKDEFVTAGGVDLSEVDPQSCQAIKHPGLFFAGEVLNVDGVTGGFNFQAAWSTAFVAAQSIVKNIK